MPYTVYFWPGDQVQNLLAALMGLWVSGCCFSVLLLGGVIFKNNYGSLLFTGAFVIALNLLNMLHALQPFSPVILTSGSMELLSGQRAALDFTLPMLVCAGSPWSFSGNPFWCLTSARCSVLAYT